MQLEIQKILHKYGLNYVKEILKLEVKERDGLVLFKYNQLDADWTQKATHECRGLILDSNNNWKIVAYSYNKFFNFGEVYADTIDWSNAIVFDKADGCCDENTILITEDGEKTIKEICDNKYYGKILAHDLNLNVDIFVNIITHSIKSNNNDWYEIELDNGELIKLTGNHKIWLPELNCYRCVKDLTEYDVILYNKKSNIMLQKIRKITKIDSVSKRYDIQTETQNFYANNILVHNSLITLFHYNDKWLLSTTGTIYADSTANGGEISFAELFWQTVDIMYGSKDIFIALLNTNYNYVFELMTPFNIVVTQHIDYKILLHGVRDLTTLKELHIHNFPEIFQVKSHDLKNIDDIKNTFNDMTWQEEGYVVCDNNFNRVKIKNPAYVSAHFIRSGMSPYHIMSVIKSNELDEFLIYFPTRHDELNGLQEKYDTLLTNLLTIYDTTLKDFVSILSDKEFAFKVNDVCIKYNLVNIINFSGLFFSLKNNKTDVRTYVNKIPDKDLYNYLKIYKI